MAKYTITIAKLQSIGYDFGLNEYPIFDERYRAALNKDILDYYFMYEIGFETPELFKHYLKNKLNLIMPKYNAMYQAQLDIIANPLGNVKLTETSTRTGESNGTTSSSSTSNGKSLFQDTPQGKITQSSIDEQTWATNVNMDKANASGSTTALGNSTEQYTKTLLGYNGYKYGVEVYNKLLTTFQSVNQMVIDDLQDLFMGVL